MVLCSLAVLTKGPSFWYAGIAASALGALIGVTALMLALIYLFFRGTRLGLAMRAAAANPESARLVGIRVGWMTALGWGIAAAIGAVAGMLIAPVVFLEPGDGGQLGDRLDQGFDRECSRLVAAPAARGVGSCDRPACRKDADHGKLGRLGRTGHRLQSLIRNRCGI